MKIIVVIICALSSIIFSCSNDESNSQNSKLVQVIRSGCADGLPPGIEVLVEQKDTVYHYFKDNRLFIYVGYRATCCIFYNYKAEIHDDDIEIELEEASNDPCDCICWYEFTFEFKDIEKKLYNYVIKIEEYISFSGQIDLRK